MSIEAIFFFIGLAFFGIGWMRIPRKFRAYILAYLLGSIVHIIVLIITLCYLPILALLVAAWTAFKTWHVNQLRLPKKIEEKIKQHEFSKK